MSRITGKEGKVSLDGNIVASTNSWVLDAKLDTVDVTAFSDVYRQNLSTFKSWTGTVEGHWEDAGGNTDFYDVLNGTDPVTIELFPVAGGTEKFSGSAFITSFSLKTPHDGAVDFSATFVGTGTLTRTP